jgi:hypothetical protein
MKKILLAGVMLAAIAPSSAMAWQRPDFRELPNYNFECES